MSAIFSFFGTTFGKLLIAGVVVLSLIGMFAYALNAHDKAVTEAARAEFNQKQYEQVLKEKAKLEKNLADLKKSAEQLASDIAQKNVELDEKDKIIQDIIDKSEDRPSSDVLKNTIKELQR